MLQCPVRTVALEKTQLCLFPQSQCASKTVIVQPSMRAHLMIAYSIMELLTWPVLAPAVLNTGTNLVVIEPLTAWGTELSSAVSRPASANDKNVVTHTHSGLATSWSWSSSSLASAFAAGRGAAQAPDRPQIHQPWATRRLLEVRTCHLSSPRLSFSLCWKPRTVGQRLDRIRHGRRRAHLKIFRSGSSTPCPLIW